MKTITAGNFFGNERKFRELRGLMSIIKPEVLIITGDIFPPETENPLIQSDFLNTCKEYFLEYCENCDKLFYIFGEGDCIFLDKFFEDMLKEETDKIVCLNHQNYDYKGHTFIGLPFVGNTKNIIKDWLRGDWISVDNINYSCVYTDNDFNVHTISNYDELLKYVDEKETLHDIIQKKLENTLNHKIFVSHYGPFSENMKQYNYCLNHFLNNIDILVIGDEESTDNQKFYDDEFNCDIISHGKKEKFLLYNINIIKNGSIIYDFHPLNSIQNQLNNSKIYRDYSYANEN